MVDYSKFGYDIQNVIISIGGHTFSIDGFFPTNLSSEGNDKVTLTINGKLYENIVVPM